MRANAQVLIDMSGNRTDPTFEAYLWTSHWGTYPTFTGPVTEQIIAWTNRLAEQDEEGPVCVVQGDSILVYTTGSETPVEYVPDEYGRYALGIHNGWDWKIKKQYGLPAQILRGPFHNANGGPSDDRDTDTVYVVGNDIPGAYPVPENAVMVKLGETAPGYVVARPVEPGQYMASGAYIVQTSCWEEWRAVFGHSLPIPLHDRTERRAD